MATARAIYARLLRWRKYLRTKKMERSIRMWVYGEPQSGEIYSESDFKRLMHMRLRIAIHKPTRTKEQETSRNKQNTERISGIYKRIREHKIQVQKRRMK